MASAWENAGQHFFQGGGPNGYAWVVFTEFELLASPLHYLRLAEAATVDLGLQGTLIFLLLHSLLAGGIC
jgi:hypothetical protein